MNAFYFPPSGVSEPGDAEAEYASLAASIGAAVPALEERITSMTFMHDAVEWVAEVGSKLRGTRWESRKIKGQKIDVPKREFGSETVVAIFKGVPYKVWLDTRPLSERVSAWANPVWTTASPTKLAYYIPPASSEAASTPAV
jgi:hypothetical protein